MDDKRKNRYKDKIVNLSKYYELLNKWLKENNFEKIIKNLEYQEIFAVYHAAQLSIEVISDICAMMVKDSQINAKDNYTNYETLNRKGILSKDLLLALKELNGLRNRIVHDYNGIIDKIAFQSIVKNLPNIKLFKETVESWLEKI
ncbi:MAG: DUF86 domain-containing protein [Candidatus Lokiarchaeota archaeon]|nr:DUF86 domain-containing protein [Candidatus Lokiarchaeota archaeon]